MHPDLALLAYNDRRDILCLALEEAEDAQLDALAGLGAFCGYRYGKTAALLFQQDSFAGLDALRRTLELHGLQAGLSGPFALPASARGCMLKAQLALETGKLFEPDNVLYAMDEWGEVALVRAAARALEQQGFIAADFCDAALGQMASQDEQKDTQYAKSMETYLRCGMDMKRAAGDLGVHRNTLAYRMERAQAMFDLDLGDMNRCFELLFSTWLSSCLPDGHAACGNAPFDPQAAQAALWRHMEHGGRPAETAQGFACVLVCVGVDELLDEGRLALLSRLMDCAPGGAAFAYDEDVLLAAVDPADLSAFLESARPLCQGLGCPVVYTQAFDAARIAHRAQLCRMALCVGAGMCVNTRDLCSTLFFMVVERCVSLAPYFCEDVLRVMDDDAQKGTALSRSLYAYLLNFRDMKRAAQQLGMHRNTMEYHMRKTNALIGSVEEEAHRFMLMCTYKMLALPEMNRYGV